MPSSVLCSIPSNWADFYRSANSVWLNGFFKSYVGASEKDGMENLLLVVWDFLRVRE